MPDLDQRIASGLRDVSGRAPIDADVWPTAQRYVAKRRRRRQTFAAAAVATALLAGGVLTASVVRSADSKVVVSHPDDTTVTTLPRVTTLAPSGPIAGAFTIRAAPTGGLSFAPSSLTVATGIYGVTLEAESNASHTLAFEDPATLWPVLTVNTAGEKRRARIFFGRPGMYTFYCVISGHRAAGMQGVVRVTGPTMTLAAAEAAARRTGGALNADA